MRQQPCFLAVLVWPIISIVFGTVAGIILGVSITAWVLILAVLRTPASILKLMRMTVSTNDNEIFSTDCLLDYPLRVAVFVLTPIPRLLFVVGLTLYCLVFGTMGYIGRLTKAMWMCEWRDLSVYGNDEDVCCPVDPSFIKMSRDPGDDGGDDDHYVTALWCLKCLCALQPGIALPSWYC